MITKERSRTYNSISNSVYGILASAITTLLNFAVRVFLVRELGDEINGIHNLFYSIANIMVLMELGIGSAMIIHLYEPIKNKEKDMISSIMGFYRKIYSIIALCFLLAGIVICIFLLDNLINSTIELNKIRIYFFLFILSYVVNYLTCSKKSILYAEQKNRISIMASAVSELLFRTTQILLILIYHNYALFLLLLILEKLACNVYCIYYVNKTHPYLRLSSAAELAKEKKDAIFKTVKPLIVNQMASTAQQSSQGILISILLGNVSVVGYFGNYNLLVGMVQLIYSQFGGAITSSFGNLAVEKDKKRLREAFERASFVMNLMAAFFCTLFFVCADDFIFLVFGPTFVLDHFSVFVLSMNMMIYLLNIPIISIQNAMGLHRYDSMYMVLQAIIAILGGYLLGKLYGMPGIFMGLLIPLIIFTLLRKGVVIGRIAMDLSKTRYLASVAYDIFEILICMAGAWLICENFFIEKTWCTLFFRFIVGFNFCFLCSFLLNMRSKHFGFFFEKFVYFIKK